MHPRLAALSLLLLVALVAPACNAVQMKRESIESTMHDAGLAPADVTLGDDTLHYWSGGGGQAGRDAPVVLFLHGFGADAIWQWYPQVEGLAGEYHAIVPDLLWFGGSGSSVRDFGLDHQVAAMRALLDHLGVREVHVVGVSYGGLVAWELAAAEPERVRTLTVVDSPGRAYQASDYTALLERFGVDHIGSVLVPSDAEGVELLLAIAYDDPPWTPDWALEQVLEELYATQRDEKVALLESVLSQMAMFQSRPQDVTQPTLLVWGRNDQVFPVELGERLAARLAGRGRLEVIEHARHAPNLEHPERFNTLLRDFLAGSH